MVIAESFDEQHEIDSTTNCWLWKRNRLPRGYGLFRANGRNVYAHRHAWAIKNGRSVPRGLCVLHKCDNPPCVNPDHLFLGTQKENMADMKKKGRGRGGASGERNGSAKLRTEDVIRIREAMLFGAKGTDLAKVYGVDSSIIYDIRDRVIWSHVNA